MNTLTEPLLNLNEFNLIKQRLDGLNKTVHITGCIDTQMSHFIAALSGGFKNKVIITFSDQKAKEIYDDMKFFDRNAIIYPAKDFIFYSADIQGNLMLKQRLQAVKRLMEGSGITLITTIDGLMDKIMPIRAVADKIMHIKTGEIMSIEQVKVDLIMLGYERTAQIDIPGQFSIRGSIIDIYPLTEEVPYRIDLWDDEVDSIKSFDVESQRSIEPYDEVSIYPCVEYMLTADEIESGTASIRRECKQCTERLRGQMRTEEAHRLKVGVEEFLEQLNTGVAGIALDSYVDYFFKHTVTLIEYFNKKDTLFIIDEPKRVSEKSSAVEEEYKESFINRLEKGYMLPGQAKAIISRKEVLSRLSSLNCILLSTLEQKFKEFEIDSKYNIDARSMNSFGNSFELLVTELKRFKKLGYKVLILSGSRTRASRLAEGLLNEGLSAFYSEDIDRLLLPGEVMVSYGNLHRGFEYPFIKFVVIAETDIFGKEKKKSKRRKSEYDGRKIQNFTELNIGDYVVHENHGLGIYRGIEKIEVDKIAKDYITIEYAKGGKLFILATQLDMIQKYAGADAKAPKLNKLGTQEWIKTKTRVRAAVKDMAKELVSLYAAREGKIGFRYGTDTVWQKEFEELFIYEETEDQLSAIEAAKKDMESTKVMDRLICGDVGYGKTEVAIRVSFKAVQENKQVVYLVPTTILAQQHYNTFTQRMKDYPVRIDLLSRFRTAAEQKKTLQDLKKGIVDIVIGTHRVLSKDVIYKDLGLLIIDEEQRFGVAHKEKIKQLKENIDVLTLTATPIPRTLHMSLIGIRDMSILKEPPVDRVPIQTYVMEYNDEMVREAINRELTRGGQVYYVYNRVNNIDEVTNQVAKLVPDANVAFAHGRMGERALEKIMYDFINGDIDVLVSTTIIETGLDISNVNTMIIHDAENLGLSQLYQLRGRVGRSNRTAYAFMMYKRDKMLREIAEKRLRAIREFTELGSGIKIAMRDLEIRGAGNILGAEQHGHMEAVGYDLYCKMLNEAVKQMKGETVAGDDYETNVDFDMDAFIPSVYIKNEYQKLNIYKKIAMIENIEEHNDMLDELIDRFGEPPKTVLNLLSVALLKAMAHMVYVTEISGGRKEIKFVMYQKAKLDVNKIAGFVQMFQGRLKFTSESMPYFTYHFATQAKDIEEVTSITKEILVGMEAISKNV